MKIAIVTGANTGLGFETSLALSKEGFKVIMGCRSEEKAQAAMKKIQNKNSGADLEFIKLDLIDRDGIRSFVESFSQKHDHLDLLINNAGVMCPDYTITKNNLELQFDANHMGHFYLTSLLMDKLDQEYETRIINVSSLAGKREHADIHFDNINFEGTYDEGPKMMGMSGMGAYSQSKLANMLFTLELKNRLEKAGKKIKSIVVHPGVSATDLAKKIPPMIKILFPILRPFFGITKAKDGAKPSLLGAMDSTIKSGDFIGPTGKAEMNGKAGIVQLPPKAIDEQLQRKIWDFSEKQLGIEFLIN